MENGVIQRYEPREEELAGLKEKRDLIYADLSGLDLHSVRLVGVTMREANLAGCNLTGAGEVTAPSKRQ